MARKWLSTRIDNCDGDRCPGDDMAVIDPVQHYGGRHTAVPARQSFSLVVGELAGRRVVDLGCGDGGYLERLGSLAVGMDISESNLAACRQKGLAVRKADLTQGLPAEEGEFDGALVSHVLEHMPDPLHLLQECRRVLTDGAPIVVGLPVEGALNRFVGDDYFDDHPGHLFAFSEKGAIRLLEQCQFRAIRFVYEPILAAKDPLGVWVRMAQRLPRCMRRPVVRAFWLVARREGNR